VDERVVFEHEQLIHFNQGTYHWVSLKQFRIDPALTDTDLLCALISHWAYHDHYGGQDAIDQDHHSLHGPYRLECIAPDTFRRARAAISESLVQAWAEEASDRSISPQVQQALDRSVYPLLSDDSLYHLPDLRPEAEYDWGWVVGREAFHEYVAIDRRRDVLTLIVAADDALRTYIRSCRGSRLASNARSWRGL
jgi:hypothetical protein